MSYVTPSSVKFLYVTKFFESYLVRPEYCAIQMYPSSVWQTASAPETSRLTSISVLSLKYDYAETLVFKDVKENNINIEKMKTKILTTG